VGLIAVGTYDELEVGAVFETPTRAIDIDLHARLIEVGGYTHPLFTDREYLATTPFDAPPLPGQALLLLMGGLVEQSGKFDDTVIALLGFDSVKFLAPAVPGMTVRVRVEVLDKEPRPDRDRGVLVLGWRCLDQVGERLVDATARMLFRTEAR
jgi:acyl dehydratase